MFQTNTATHVSRILHSMSSTPDVNGTYIAKYRASMLVVAEAQRVGMPLRPRTYDIVSYDACYSIGAPYASLWWSLEELCTSPKDWFRTNVTVLSDEQYYGLTIQ